MVFTNATTAAVQELVTLQYESFTKILLLVGWYLLALYYLKYRYKQQEPTKVLLLGTWRAIMYIMSWMWSILFWLITPVYLHPNVSLDQLLIFLAWSYTGITTVFLVIFLFNATLWIPMFVLRFGKLNVEGFEDHALRNIFEKARMSSWFKKK